MANEQNLTAPPIRTSEEAVTKGRQGGIKSGQVRRERKTIREIVRALLDEQMPGTDLTRGQAIALNTLGRAYKSGKPADLKVIAEIAGELEQTVNLNATTTQIIVADKDTAAHLSNLRNKGTK